MPKVYHSESELLKTYEHVTVVHFFLTHSVD